jgi:hypothetical protein
MRNSIILILIILFLFGCTSKSIAFGPFVPDRHRVFFAKTVNNLEALVDRGDFENELLSQYTIDNTIFLVRLDIHNGNINKGDIKKDMADSYYILDVYTKNQNNVICRIKQLRLVTSLYEENISKLIYYRNSASSNETNNFKLIKFPFYRRATIIGGSFKYPRPKDMYISIILEVEMETDEKISTYEFTYYYKLTMKDRWFSILD